MVEAIKGILLMQSLSYLAMAMKKFLIERQEKEE